jgi:hypothetical protein
MEIYTLMKNLEASFLSLPNVTAVSVGKKNGEEVINVYVTDKFSESQPNKSESIPKKVGKFEIEVRIERRKAMRSFDDMSETEGETAMPFPPNEILSRMELLISAAQQA